MTRRRWSNTHHERVDATTNIPPHFRHLNLSQAGLEKEECFKLKEGEIGLDISDYSSNTAWLSETDQSGSKML